jgi:hypothetical protein
VLGLGPILVFALSGLIASASSLAQDGASAPTISGTPIVGGTLTAAQAPGDTHVFQWQRCNPATSNCTGGDKNDPNYVSAGVGGNGADTYQIPAADLGFFIRVLGKDTSLGSQFVPSAPVGPVTAPPGTLLAGAAQLGIAPQHGISLLGQPSEGVVKLKLPGQKKFSKMSGIQLIPVNTVINARKGTIQLIAAVGEFANTDPDASMEFFDGVFKIKQADATNAPALAKLVGNLGCGGKKKKGGAAASAAGPVAQAAGRRKRGLWGRGRGNYGTRGRGGTGSVVGTTWFTKDTCAGTFWKVTEGVGISVDPKGKKKDVLLGPGDDYFAER